jgi:hypothetical protein
MKNIVICCDGTWNTPDERDQGVPVPTNVVRIFNAVATSDKKGVGQHKYYHPGVGTDGSWWDKAIGGGTGRGLDRNIMSAYRELCDHYDAGDRIFLFGFSRGAYTVRSLAGFVARCGLLDTTSDDLAEAQIWQRIERVFNQGYRRRSETREQWDSLGWKFKNPKNSALPVRFLGVWDTVGSLGIPDDMALLNLLDKRHDYTFHDTALSPSIEIARHAVALDEKRASFQPTLWTSAGDDAKQIWFAGVHADVGGGYRETGLSDWALAWMIDEAATADLAFDPAMLQQIKPSEFDALHESCCGAFALLPTQPRAVPSMADERQVHKSARRRHQNPPIHQCPYRADRVFDGSKRLVLDIFAQQDWNSTGIWLEEGRPYTFKATGEWMDGSVKCGPAGTDDGHFQLAEVADVAGTLLGKAEQLFKKITGNASAEFRFTRRHEGMPWFALVGAIANGGGVDAKGHAEPHESFLIGSGMTCTPRRSGYLYAYANDAWNCYGNNRGHVELTIEPAASGS